MFFKILDKYIFSELLKTLIIAVSLLTLILTFGVSMQIVRKFSQFLSLIDYLSILPYVVGSSLSLIIPISLLASTTLVYGKMSHDKEILILRSAGVHLNRVFLPGIIIAILLSGICFYINAEIIPMSYIKRKEITFKSIELILSATFSENETSITFIPNVRIYYKKLKNGKFQHLLIQKIKEAEITEEILANEGYVIYDKSKNILNFELYNGSVTIIKRENKKKEEKFLFNYLNFPLSLTNSKKINLSRTKYKTVNYLREEVDNLSKKIIEIKNKINDKNLPKQNLTVLKNILEHYNEEYYGALYELHTRYANSFAPLIMLLLGAPLGILIKHNNKLVAFGISSLPVIFLYYPLGLIGEALENISPFLAGWSANIITGILGISLCIYVYRK